MAKRPTVFFLLDGLSDEIVNNKTPLREANKENINYISKRSFLGKFRIIEKWDESYGKSVSHLALLRIFGYEEIIGRGALEVIGNDMPFENGNLALRGNFSTVEKDILIDRRAERNLLNLDNLIEEVKENVDIKFSYQIKRGYAHRVAFLLKGNHSKNISYNDVDVGEKIKRILPLDTTSVVTAKILQDFVDKSFSILDKSKFNEERERNGIKKANYFIFRNGENYLPRLKKKFKKDSLAIVENGVVKGCCILAGFKILTVPEIISSNKIDHEKTIEYVFKNIEENLDKFKFIFTHLKAFDEASHDKNFELKKHYIEVFDKNIGKLIDKDLKIVITTDHSTSSLNGKHIFSEVPLLIYGIKKRSSVKMFDEISISKLRNTISPKQLWRLI
ncbi:MAG: hypothetical protein RMJ17_02875 [Candidatus Aenigmarchaeota archaeon]|nr:hypothetical protein [Candidatus Aenigmarchaeota archaeon]MDW8149510.1 hypothetical protein [Candidatus Aenigmarchaeota archaeon]